MTLKFVAPKKCRSNNSHLGILVAHTVSVIGVDWSEPLDVQYKHLTELRLLRHKVIRAQTRPPLSDSLEEYSSTQPLFQQFVDLARINNSHQDIPTQNLNLWISARSKETPQTILDFVTDLKVVDEIRLPNTVPKITAKSPRDFLLKLFQYCPKFSVNKSKQKFMDIHPDFNMGDYQSYFGPWRTPPTSHLDVWERLL